MTTTATPIDQDRLMNFVFKAVGDFGALLTGSMVVIGDKLGLYNDRLKKYKLYGAEGKVLKTPEDYRDSTLWCTTGVDREGVLPVWSVDCWHFKGMARAGSVETRTGTGDQAPSTAFR